MACGVVAALDSCKRKIVYARVLHPKPFRTFPQGWTRNKSSWNKFPAFHEELEDDSIQIKTHGKLQKPVT